MLGDVARERHGEIEAQRQLGLLALLQRAGRLHEVDLPLGLAALLVSSTSENSITGVSIGRKPKRSKLRRIASSMRWNAIWSSGSSSSTPGMVRAWVTAMGVLRNGATALRARGVEW